MSEEKLKGTLYEDQEAVKHFRDFENRYYQQVTVTGVTGQCPYGHTQGDQYRVSNCNNDGLCGALYTSIHHSIVTLHYWGSLPWSKNPDTYLGMCPEMKVQVAIRRMEQEKRNLLKTQVQPRNMVGKGFPAIDKYRAFVEILDDSQGVGDRTVFLEKLGGWAEVLLLTSTSILNQSTEELLAHLAPNVTKVIMLGPSTPVVPEAFSHLPVSILAGTVPVDHAAVLRAVRHGQGTPVIHRFSRKVCARG